MSLSEVERFHTALFTAALFPTFERDGVDVPPTPLSLLPPHMGLTLAISTQQKKKKVNVFLSLLSAGASQLISLCLFVIKCSEQTIGVSLRDGESKI